MKSKMLSRIVLVFLALTVTTLWAYRSTNIAGFQIVPINTPWRISGFAFEDFGGGPISPNDSIPFREGMTKNQNSSFADQLQVFEILTGAYTTFFISNGLNAKGDPIAGLTNKWLRAGTTVIPTNTYHTGRGFWYKPYSSASYTNIIIMGQVPLDATREISIPNPYVLIASPYPVPLPLNDGIPYVVGMTASNSYDVADTIQIPNAAGGYDIFYLSDGRNSDGEVVVGLSNKWVAVGTYLPATNCIPVTVGCWYLRKGTNNFVITVPRPFDVE